jgi:hypothetical protein
MPEVFISSIGFEKDEEITCHMGAIQRKAINPSRT